MAGLILHSLRGFPVTDLAAHLPIQLAVRGQLRADVSAHFWYCQVEPALDCRLAEDVQRDHINPVLLSEDGVLTLEAVVITPTLRSHVLQPGITDLPVHVAAVLDPAIRTTGRLDLEKVGYLGCARVDEA